MALLLYSLPLAAANVPSMSALQFSRAHTKLSELHADNARWPNIHPNGAIARAEAAVMLAGAAVAAEEEKRKRTEAVEKKKKDADSYVRLVSQGFMKKVLGVVW